MPIKTIPENPFVAVKLKETSHEFTQKSTKKWNDFSIATNSTLTIKTLLS